MKNEGKLIEAAHSIERVVVIALMFLMLAVVVVATIELALLLFQELTNPAEGLLFIEVDELIDLFGFFLLVLIGVELLETIRMYLHDDTVHAEIVLLVALIAVARKLVVLDLKAYEPLTLFALAAIVLALAAGYVLIKKYHAVPDRPPDGA